MSKCAGTRALIQNVGLFAVVQAFLGDATGLLAVVANNAPFLLTQKFSRDHEREADEQGLRYLAAAKLNPRGLITFFEKMRREEERMKEQIPGGDALDADAFAVQAPGMLEIPLSSAAVPILVTGIPVRLSFSIASAASMSPFTRSTDA